MPKKINNFMTMARDNDTVKINIYGEIVSTSKNWDGSDDETVFGATELKNQLDLLDNVSNLEIFINSPGGNAFGGVAIYNALKRYPARKKVYIDGIAASAASIIAMAGDEIVMPIGSMMMIHKALTIAVGNSDEMLKVADMLDKVDKVMNDIYFEKTGLDREVIADLVAKETWMNSEEALKLGFATSMTDNLKVVAKLDGDRLNVNNIDFDNTNTPGFESLKNKIKENVVKNVDKLEEKNNNRDMEGNDNEKIAEQITQFINIFKEEKK